VVVALDQGELVVANDDDDHVTVVVADHEHA
jgi:hypothetical protein